MLTDANFVTKNDELEEEEAEMEVSQWSFDIGMIPKSHLMSRPNLEELMERAVYFWVGRHRTPDPKPPQRSQHEPGQYTAPL